MAKPHDLYQRITDRIIADLKDGVPTWRKPWNATGCAGVPLRANGEAYKGINVLILWAETLDKGYRSPYWLTFKAGEGRRRTRPQGRARQLRILRQDGLQARA